MTSVLVMAKAPRAGTVKTRLHPLLGPVGSAALQAALLFHTYTVAASTGMTVRVAYDPPDAHDELSALLGPGAELLPQQPGDLGRRMTAAVSAAHDRSTGPVVVVGVDAPTLTATMLVAAATALEGPGEADVVLGPALDGGYYLVGVRRPTPPAFDIDPALWSGPRVLEATLRRLQDERLTTQLLPPLRDLDTPADAAALLQDPDLPAAIADLLRAPAALPAEARSAAVMPEAASA